MCLLGKSLVGYRRINTVYDKRAKRTEKLLRWQD
jgi:hypothetical protein